MFLIAKFNVQWSSSVSSAISSILTRGATAASLDRLKIGASALRVGLDVTAVLFRDSSIGYKCWTGLSRYNFTAWSLAPLTTPRMIISHSSICVFLTWHAFSTVGPPVSTNVSHPRTVPFQSFFMFFCQLFMKTWNFLKQLSLNHTTVVLKWSWIATLPSLMEGCFIPNLWFVSGIDSIVLTT